MRFIFMLNKIFVQYGFQMGCRKQVWRPNFNNYACGFNEKFYLLDLNKTRLFVYKALLFVKGAYGKGNSFLFLDTKFTEEFLNLIFQDTSLSIYNRLHLVRSWVGGFLTNFFIIVPQLLRPLTLNATLLPSQISFLFLFSFPTISIIGNVLKEFAALRENNLLNMPVIGVVDGSLLYNGGGVTFPIFARNYVFIRLLLFRLILQTLKPRFFTLSNSLKRSKLVRVHRYNFK